ncbi:MAG: hypothetical protein M1514_02560 [Patescibacteria group bacterium]|nr:hypothetical protein [Patescibacteria group bacterium]
MEENTNFVPESLTKIARPSSANPFIFVLIVFFIVSGIVSGYFLAKRNQKSSAASATVGTVSKDKIVKGSEFGVKDVSTFKDTATGSLEAGGLEGEGTHKIIREGGPSQTVYVISSVLDLDQFVGKKVQVWGETMKAQKAGWLMDVGRIKILE